MNRRIFPLFIPFFLSSLLRPFPPLLLFLSIFFSRISRMYPHIIKSIFVSRSSTINTLRMKRKREALKKRRWLPNGDDEEARRYGKMYVSGYSGGSWESSFDSQCLEIIRSRGSPGVATATANHRAKKNFSLYNAHFSVLVFAWAPNRNARGSRQRSRGLVRGSTTTKATR